MKLTDKTLQKEHASLLTRRLSLIAAAIVVVIVVGSMTVLLQLAAHKQTSVAQPNQKMLFALVNRTLYRLDTNTHQPLWHFNAPAGTDVHFSTIPNLGQAVNDTYYTFGISGLGSSFLDLSSTKGKLYALDIATGKIRWQADIKGGNLASMKPVIAGGTVYVSQIKDSYLTIEALNSASGAKKWEQRVGNKIAANNNVPTNNNTHIQFTPLIDLIAASDSAVYGDMRPGAIQVPSQGSSDPNSFRFALSAQDGHLLWQKSEEIANVSAIDQGFLVDGVLCVAKESMNIKDITTHQSLYQLLGYDAASGERLWSKPIDNSRSLSMYGTKVLNGIIYLSATNGPPGQGSSIYAFAVKDGRLVWRYQDTDKSGSSYAMVTEKNIYINRYGSEKGVQEVAAIDTASGKLRWTYAFHDPLTVEYPPAADNDHVYLSLPGNTIQILQASDGKAISSFKVNDKVDPNNRVLLQAVE